MQTRTFRARSMKEALARVRKDLGGDALILASREVRGRRLFGFGATALFEVTATDGSDDARANRDESARGETNVRATVPVTIPRIQAAGGLQAAFGERLGRLHAMVDNLSRRGFIDHLIPELPSELVSIYAQLIEADVPEVLARRLVRYVAETLEPSRIDQSELVTETLGGAIESCIPIAPPIRAISGLSLIHI